MYYDGSVMIEDEDQCLTCEYFMKSVMCPLIEALAVGVVEMTDPDEGYMVRNCGFYVQFERHLRLVPHVQPE